jgi:NAD(P)-dependent dehydrogenase (short-subunit alcohol dehydrogenase family)
MSTFNPDTDIPSLSGKVVLVTGGNTGLGLETVRQLSKHDPAEILLAARTRARAEGSITKLREENPDACKITFVELDLTSLDSVKRAADEVKSKHSQLHLLINNAGIMNHPAGLTKDGYEIQFGTNHMGHALLTKLLLPTLQATAKTGQDVRIITLSSRAETMSPSTLWDFGALKTDMSSKITVTRYGISKVANIHHSRALSRRYPDIRCIAVHPGIVVTELGRGTAASYPILSKVLGAMRWTLGMTGTPVHIGALNQLWASVSPDAESGKFYYPVGEAVKGSSQSQNKEYEDQLWEWTEKELERFN